MKRTSCLTRCLLLGATGLGACATEGDLVELGTYNRGVQGDDAAASDAGPALAAEGGPEATEDAGPPGQNEPSPTLPPPCASYGCFSNVPSIPDQELHCQRFVAHAPEDPARPYDVPVMPDHYVRFTFKQPQASTEYTRSIKPIISQAIALHHMKLYESHGEIPEGVEVGGVTPAALRLVFAWAPGSSTSGGLYLDKSVGIEMQPNTFYTLETHLSLVTTQNPIVDASGFEVCSSSQKPSHTVSITRLGSDPVLSTSVSSTCTPKPHGAPIYLLTAQAQMNIRGFHATMVINRPLGRQETIYDRLYDFTDANIVPLPGVFLSPGDTVTTRCEYGAPSSGGPGVFDERCAMYVLHWPAHTLVSTSAVGPGDACAL